MINIHLSSSNFPLSKAASSTLRKRVCSSSMKAQDDKKTITEDGNSEQTRKPVLDFLCIFFFLCFDGRMKRNPPSPPKDGQNERDKNMFQREIFLKLHVLLTLFSRELKVLFLCERTEVMVMPVRWSRFNVEWQTVLMFGCCCCCYCNNSPEIFVNKARIMVVSEYPTGYWVVATCNVWERWDVFGC